MKNKFKRMMSKVLAAVLVVSMAVPWTAMTAVAEGEGKAGTVTITDASQLEPYFPDANFRAAVFAAVRDGNDGAEGTDVVDALANFLGDVKAKKKGITNVTGLDLLRKANIVNLEHNEITDFSHLGKNVGDPNYKTWFGVDDGEGREAGTNVYWQLGGNPFEKLPSSFGGRLVIKQPASTSYTYAETLDSHYTYVRPDAGSISGELNIAKTKIYDGADSRNAKVDSVEWNEHGTIEQGGSTTTFDVKSFNDETAEFENLKKSGVAYVGVGMEQELHYQTTDEAGTITPGSQSFKYYLPNSYSIYDRVTVLGPTTGSATLIKVDKADNKPLSGAVFSLFKKDGTLVLDGLTSGADGKIVVDNLDPGSYYFKETAAPEGYLMSSTSYPVEVSIPQVTIGGKKEVTPTGESTITAGDNEVFIAGPKGNDNDTLSPDITLDAGTSTIKNIKVNYSNLEVDGVASAVEKNFGSTDEAAADINAEKEKNTILGPVTIEAEFDSAVGNDNTVTAENVKKELVSVKGTKHWIDNKDWQGTRPEVTIHLLRDGELVGGSDGTIVLPASNTSEGDDFPYEFKDLPKTDQDGKPYIYTVSEEPVISKDDPEGYVSSVKGYDITNQWVVGSRFHIEGEKVWEDFENADGSRPESVTFILKQNGKEFSRTTSFENTGWKYSFKNLPKWEKVDEKLYTYTLEEEAVEGYRESLPISVELIKETPDNGTINVNITNTFRNDIEKLEGEKIWKDFDNVEKKRPDSVTVELLQDDKAYGTPVTITQADDWKYSFTGLPKYNKDTNKAYIYTVKEVSEPEGYKSVVSDDGKTITNTLDTNTESISGQKIWNDEDNAYGLRPGTLNIILKQNGDVYETQTIDATKEWKYSFAGLPKYDDDGKLNQYTVEEDMTGLDSYKSEISSDGKTITNSLLGTVTLKKVDGNKQPLADVYFSLYKKAAGTEKFDKLGDYCSTDTGLTIYDLAWGEYYIQEFSTVAGYQISDEKHEFEIGQGDGKKLRVDLGEIVNEKIKISFTKYGNRGEICATDYPLEDVKLEGAEFAIYTDKECTNLVPIQGAVTANTAVSSAEGIVEFVGLPVGVTYYLKETKAPGDYLLDKTVYPVTIATDGTYEVTKDGKIVNDLRRADIKMKKVSEQDPTHALAGSTYGLYKKTDDLIKSGAKLGKAAKEDMPGWTKIAEAITDKDGMLAFEGVLVNTAYRVRELKAPSGSHVSANPIEMTFEVVEENGEEVVKLKLSDNGSGTAQTNPDTGEIEWLEPSIMLGFSKTDTNGKMLPGAKLELQDMKGAVIDAWTSTEEVYVIQADKMDGKIVAGGKYQLVEKAAPEGYQLAKPVEFTVESKPAEPGVEYIQQIVMKDEIIPMVTINLIKNWSDKGKETSCPDKITVNLYSSIAPGKVMKEITLSKVNGYKATVTELPKVLADGTEIQYSLKENTVKGYKLTSQKASFNEKTNTWTVTLTNTTTSPDTPEDNPKTPLEPGDKIVKTGDTASVWIYLLTIIGAVIAAGTVLYAKRKRKR